MRKLDGRLRIQKHVHINKSLFIYRAHINYMNKFQQLQIIYNVIYKHQRQRHAPYFSLTVSISSSFPVAGGVTCLFSSS